MNSEPKDVGVRMTEALHEKITAAIEREFAATAVRLTVGQWIVRECSRSVQKSEASHADLSGKS